MSLRSYTTVVCVSGLSNFHPVETGGECKKTSFSLEKHKKKKKEVGPSDTPLYLGPEPKTTPIDPDTEVDSGLPPRYRDPFFPSLTVLGSPPRPETSLPLPR